MKQHKNIFIGIIVIVIINLVGFATTFLMDESQKEIRLAGIIEGRQQILNELGQSAYACYYINHGSNFDLPVVKIDISNMATSIGCYNTTDGGLIEDKEFRFSNN